VSISVAKETNPTLTLNGEEKSEDGNSPELMRE
jgi:hypothetical protein